MKFEGLIPVIKCNNIEQTLSFYQQALRYIVINKTETEEGLQWVYLKSDNTFLMLQKVDNITTKHMNYGNILLHYYTNDVTAQHQFITAKGYKTGQIEETPYHIRQFFLEDPEGNVIAIGQDIKN